MVFPWLSKRRNKYTERLIPLVRKEKDVKDLLPSLSMVVTVNVTTHSSSSQPGRVQTPSDRTSHTQLFRFTLSLRLSFLLAINLSMPPSVCVWFSVCRPLSFFQSVCLCPVYLSSFISLHLFSLPQSVFLVHTSTSSICFPVLPLSTCGNSVCFPSSSPPSQSSVNSPGSEPYANERVIRGILGPRLLQALGDPSSVETAQ